MSWKWNQDEDIKKKDREKDKYVALVASNICEKQIEPKVDSLNRAFGETMS